MWRVDLDWGNRAFGGDWNMACVLEGRQGNTDQRLAVQDPVYQAGSDQALLISGVLETPATTNLCWYERP